MKSKHFTRKTNLKILLGTLLLLLILSIIESFIIDPIISIIISSIIIVICILSMSLICFSKPDYDFHVQYDSPYIVFKMSKDDIRVFYSEDMKIKKKNSHYLIVSNSIEQMTIPYSKEIEEFLRELL